MNISTQKDDLMKLFLSPPSHTHIHSRARARTYTSLKRVRRPAENSFACKNMLQLTIK